MLNTFQWPHGEKSGAAIAALCANARLIVPLAASGYLGLTLRAARSPHSLIACLVPFHTDTHPGGIFCCSRDDVNAWSKRRSPSRSAASVPCEYRSACTSRICSSSAQSSPHSCVFFCGGMPSRRRSLIS